MWNRSGKKGTEEHYDPLMERTPFLWKGIGGEFVSWESIKWQHVMEHLGHRIELTRSRPYHKNDQSWVEQKNYMHVRQFLGYE